MRFSSCLRAALAGAVLFTGGCGTKFDQEAWLAAAKVGPRSDPSESLADIETKARAEGKVVVWSLSSRLEETGKAFEQKYGIKCEVQAMGTQDLINKVRLDQRAGGHHADAYLFGDAPEVLSTLLKEKTVWNWIPPGLDQSIPANLREPLLTHHVSAVCLIYNSDKYGESPVKSWWDLTTPEWKGRAVMKDLSKAGGSLHLFTAFVQHSDELAADYEARFGEKLVLDGTPNAGYEFLKRFLANSPIFTASGSDAADKVGADNVANPPVGVMTLGKVRYKGERSLNLKWASTLTPVAGLAYPDPIGVANGATNVNAAKLFIAFAIGQEGYKPYMEYGTWPARLDLPLHEELPALADARVWFVDPEFNFKERKAMGDFILQHR